MIFQSFRLDVSNGFAAFAGGVATRTALNDCFDTVAVVATVASGFDTAWLFDRIARAAVLFAVGRFSSFNRGPTVRDQAASAD